MFGPLIGPLETKAFMSDGGGGVVSPLESCSSESWAWSHAVLVKTSHLVFTLPSKARSFVSFGGLSPLAETALILSAMLPGRPERELPVTPDIFLLPWASVSAVFVQSSARSPA